MLRVILSRWRPGASPFADARFAGLHAALGQLPVPAYDPAFDDLLQALAAAEGAAVTEAIPLRVVRPNRRPPVQPLRLRRARAKGRPEPVEARSKGR